MVDLDRRARESLRGQDALGVEVQSALTVYRVRPAWRLARLFERISGSMGITRSGR